eukprot:SAG11_NODE_16624_length_542_cov_0.932280_1_plen_80_part_10
MTGDKTFGNLLRHEQSRGERRGIGRVGTTPDRTGQQRIRPSGGRARSVYVGRRGAGARVVVGHVAIGGRSRKPLMRILHL